MSRGGVVDRANAGFEEDREEPLPTPHQDKMRQAAFSSGQARYSTAHGAPIQVVSLSVALMLAKQLEDTERATAQRPEELTPQFDVTDLWYKEFVSKSHCGLCGNRGLISTNVRTAAGFECGFTDRPCICPNGRAIKRQSSGPHSP